MRTATYSISCCHREFRDKVPTWHSRLTRNGAEAPNHLCAGLVQGVELTDARRTFHAGRYRMIQGSCLCGGVRFQIAHAVGPLELCHCTRCRKVSGSAFVAGLRVLREDFQLLQGRELIQSYEAPIREGPPPYRTSFCSHCGSPVPNPSSTLSWFEIPAGLLDDDPRLRPDKHVFVERKSPWFTIADDLPRLDRIALRAFRDAHPRP